MYNFDYHSRVDILLLSLLVHHAYSKIVMLYTSLIWCGSNKKTRTNNSGGYQRQGSSRNKIFFVEYISVIYVFVLLTKATFK